MNKPLAIIIVIVVGMLGYLTVYSQTGSAPQVVEKAEVSQEGGAAQPAGGYGAAPAAGGYGAPQPAAGGYGAPQPAAGGYGAPPPPKAGGYGAPPGR